VVCSLRASLRMQIDVRIAIARASASVYQRRARTGRTTTPGLRPLGSLPALQGSSSARAAAPLASAQSRPPARAGRSAMAGAYYDHEGAYRRIAAAGGRGWDDRDGGGGASAGSYEALDEFLASSLCPAASSTARAIDLGCGGGQGAIRLAQRGFAVTGV